MFSVQQKLIFYRLLIIKFISLRFCNKIFNFTLSNFYLSLERLSLIVWKENIFLDVWRVERSECEWVLWKSEANFIYMRRELSLTVFSQRVCRQGKLRAFRITSLRRVIDMSAVWELSPLYMQLCLRCLSRNMRSWCHQVVAQNCEIKQLCFPPSRTLNSLSLANGCENIQWVV